MGGSIFRKNKHLLELQGGPLLYSYKWSYNPYKWPYKWVTGVITLFIGVITPFITGRVGCNADPMCQGLPEASWDYISGGLMDRAVWSQ